MQNEKELRAQAQQQFQDYMQKKQQESGRELSDDDLEKVAGGSNFGELFDMYFKYSLDTEILGGNPLSFDDWMSSNGYSINWF